MDILDIFITRDLPPTPMGRRGTLTTKDGKFTSKTLELPWRNDYPNISSIPTGSFPAPAPVYGGNPHIHYPVYQLKGVPGANPGTWREACEIHNGNYAGDTTLGYKSDVEGCILLGDSFGELQPGGYLHPQLAILNSVVTLQAFMAYCAGRGLLVHIQDSPEVAAAPAA